MYDLAIIGAGWAGFNAAIRAKELGLRVCLIDKGPIGGTCLNQGCIPTKSLIQSARVYSLIKKSSAFGVESGMPTLNIGRMLQRKDKIIQQLSTGMQFMLKGVDFINSPAEILSSQEIKISDKTINAKNIIIATGSKPAELGQLKFDGSKIISSNELLNISNIPGKLLIVGGGVIGCEFAGLFSNLGTQVTLVEKLAQLLPGQDTEIAKKLESVFKKKGIKVNTGTDISNFDLSNYDLILVCVGRSANIQNLGLETLNIKVERNRIAVDDFLATNLHNIYAAGDCTGKIMLAHYASYQGRIAVDNIFLEDKTKADNSIVPNCIFTDPEVATVGITQEQADAQGLQVKVTKFDFLGSAAARIIDEAEGLIKVISDNNTDNLLGASIFGPKACELISIFTVALSARLKVKELRETIFAHPTLSEAIQESLR